MKSQLEFDRQRNRSEEGKTGRLLILHKRFSSTPEVLDEMHSLRCVEHTGKAKHTTPVVGVQIDIANAFGVKIPDGCAPKYTSRKRDAPHRGRPAKPKTSVLEY